MKRILIRSGKSPLRVASQEEFLQQDLIGTNSGNLMFSDATHKILSTGTAELTSTDSYKTDISADRAAYINERFDAFVIPLANAFRPSFRTSLDRLSKLVEQLTVPVVVLGVGAQVSTNYDTKRLQPMEASVKRFVRAVLARSASIGVRGELTASYLTDLGFKDVDIIGCPSMFLHGETFPVPRDPGTIDASSRIAINLSPGVSKLRNVAEMVRHAHDRFPRLTYFAQNLTDADLLFWGDTSVALGATPEFPTQMAHPLLRENKVRVPLDPRTWLEELATHDFSYGTRIHGNIAPLLAGTPSVVLVHDSRTLELCRYFDIPYRMLKDVPGDIHPADLHEQADYGPLVNNHRERWDRFADFLDRNGLQNTFTHGDRGAAFEARLAALKLPPPVSAWDGTGEEAVHYRVSRLHERTAQAERSVASLTKQNKDLQRQLAALEKRLASVERRTTLRIGPAIRRRVRNMRADNH